MYKLYLKYPLTKLDMSEKDEDFIDTMSIILEDNPEARFTIKKDDEGEGEMARSVNGMSGFLSFVEECNERKNKTKRLVK